LKSRCTEKQIAAEVGVSPATVRRVLKRRELNKLSALEPAEPIRRYERENPSDLIHLDIKKPGRIGSVGHRITARQAGVVNRHQGIGWEFVHICIDDASRVAFVQVMADQRKESAVTFLQAAVAYYAKLAVRIERVMTDNGSCYRSKAFRTACARLACAKFSPGRTRPRPTERPSASSKPPCANGPTPRPTPTPTVAPPNCQSDSIATIAVDLMAA
jgi:transposase InsO family protein